jgi:hypothetical protein
MCASERFIFPKGWIVTQMAVGAGHLTGCSAGMSPRQSGYRVKVITGVIQSNTQDPINELKQRLLTMLYTIAVILLILWLLGLVTSTTVGGFIHILLVIAIVVILLRIISGRKPL